MKSGEKKMFIDAKEAGRLLSLSPSFLRKLAREAKIPFYRMSKRTTRFDMNELRHYMRLVAAGKPVARSEENATRD